MALRSESIEATDAASSPLTTAVTAAGLKWAYHARAERSLLCLFVREGREAGHHTMRVASPRVIAADRNSYTGSHAAEDRYATP